jgi:hypothetical protein
VSEAPSAPASLAQFRSDGSTPVATGSTVPERSLVFTGVVEDVDVGDALRLEVEVQPVGQPFTGMPTGSSVAVSSGQTAAATIAGLPDDVAYHWQARTTDQAGRSSTWVAFGANDETEPDFAVAVPATRLAFGTQPSTTAAGTTISPAVTVQAFEASGQLDTAYGGSVTVALAPGTGDGGATLSGTTTVAATSGVATFASLAIDNAATAYRLQATSAGLTSATSDPFDVIAGGAARLVFTVQPANAVAGGTIQPAVEVTALDAQGNVALGFAGSVSLQITSGTGAPGASLSGTTSVSVTASNGVAAFSTLSIDLAAAGYALTASSADFASVTSAAFDVAPGPAVAAGSGATVPNGVAGSPTTIVIVVRDAAGNRVPGQEGALAVSIAGTNSGAAVSAITQDPTDTTYAASYVPSLTGSDLVAVTLGGAALAGSPYASAVTAGGASAANSSATVPATGTAGLATPIVITVRDANDNPVAGQAANLVVSVTGANTLTAPQPTDNGDGTYTTSYTPTVAGTDNVAITLSGTPISGSPYTSVVGAGPPSPSTTTASVPATGAAGSPTTITITVRDQNDNVVTGQAANLVVSVTGANTVTAPQPTDNGDGTYTTSYTPTVAGTDNVAITLSGTAISGSPYASVVAAGPPSPTNTTASVPGGVVGTATGIVITVRDAGGNPVTGQAANLAVSVTGANTVTAPQPTDNGDGTYTTSYTPTVAGTDNVAITLSGTAISGSPYTSEVSPGVVAGLAFRVQPSATVVNTPISPPVQVAAVDSWGNVVPTFQKQVTLVLANNPTGASLSPQPARQQASQGIATFSNLTVNLAGTGYTLSASAPGEPGPATSAPFDIVAAAPGSPASSTTP